MPIPEPTKYKYQFYNLTSQRSKEIECNEALPHLQVGHELNISLQDVGEEHSDHLDGGPLVITNVRMFLTLTKGSWTRYEVLVFCKEQDSPVQL